MFPRSASFVHLISGRSSPPLPTTVVRLSVWTHDRGRIMGILLAGTYLSTPCTRYDFMIFIACDGSFGRLLYTPQTGLISRRSHLPYPRKAVWQRSSLSLSRCATSSTLGSTSLRSSFSFSRSSCDLDVLFFLWDI